MRYKTQVLNKLEQSEAIALRLQIQLNRNSSFEEINTTLTNLKESLQEIHSVLSLEDDEFEKQF